MDFLSVILFIILYHLRPHEWIGAVASVRPAMITMLMAIYGTVTREKGFSLSLFLKTPHDWLMLFYLGWIVSTAPSPFQTWKVCYSLFLYYFIITLALSSIERMRVFMRWWAIMLVFVAIMAVASEYGFDPMYSYDITHGAMKGRLVLNTSIFYNPNALGHSVIPAIAMMYFLFWWKRFFTFKVMFVPLAAICGYCTFLTQSKGAFLSAFATWVTSYMFRRPLVVQLMVAVIAYTAGTAALKTLPRMTELESPRAEGGIQGRIWVFTWGLETFKRTTTGVGWGGFESGFARVSGFPKAPHSSYVAIGAELGWPGLTLFVAIIYCGFKTLFLARTKNDEEERVRRILFVLLVSYTVSSWMVGWSTRANFFIMLAVTAAFHRHLLGMNDALSQVGEADGNRHDIKRMETAQMVVRPNQTGVEERQTMDPASDAAKNEATDPPGITWNKLGWKDLVAIGVLTYAVVRIWSYAVYRM
ncbi:MAG: O-Antigen ligase [Verrucomicrobia bacterium]|jgi:O-antigen ligase|nr:O-Antigen ligase [Verrucomicrobiota bacterium]